MLIGRRRFIGASLAGIASLAGTPRIAAAASLAHRPPMLEQALAALDRHARTITQRDRVGLVDFSARSGDLRFHLIDLAGGRTMRSYLVSHGKGSDPGHTGMVQTLSNRPGSNASSGGAFLTGQVYYGKHGRSRRLHGLEAQNSNAYGRAIVIHGANYVSGSMARDQGRIGRSLGCFAFEQSTINEVLDRLGEGRLLFAAR